MEEQELSPGDIIVNTNAMISEVINNHNNCKYANDVSTRGRITSQLNTLLSKLEQIGVVIDSRVTCNLTNNTRFEDDVLCVDVLYIPDRQAESIQVSFVLDFDADESTPEDNFARAMMGV